MPTTSRTSVSALSTDLKAKLATSQSATIYVPLDEGADTPTDDELKALAADGLHVEHDVVRNALAVRNATEDEIAEATPEPASTSTSSSSSRSSSTA